MAGKKTPLYDWHVGHGAVMASFGGYDMPLWFPAGVKAEHMAVLTACGMFDTSHMAVLRLTGPDIYQLLQRCLSRDLDRCVGKEKAPLSPGRAVYGVFLSEAGGLVDDVIVFQIAPEEYLAVVNSGMGAHTAHHILNYIDTCENSCNVIVSDLTDKVGKIDVQGPLAGLIMKEVLADAGRVLTDMPYFSFKGSIWGGSEHTGEVRLLDGTPVLLSRSGYTGEFGFELFIEPARLTGAWEMIHEAGAKRGLLPCGLAARDSLRAGAVLPLSHQDNGNWRYLGNPWSLALPYDDTGKGFTKDFLGRQALESMPPSYYTQPFVGYDLRKVTAVLSPPVVVDRDNRVIGIVLTCVTDMGIDRVGDRIFSIASPDRPEGFVPKGLACGFVKTNRKLDVGEPLILRNGKREINVVVTDDIRPDRTAREPLAKMMRER
jgi:aminomethyltransferase